MTNSKKPSFDFPDDYHREFHALLGYAISRWAHIDRVAFELFDRALGSTVVAASIVYFRYTAIGQRLDLTTEMLEASDLSKELKNHWNACLQSIKTLIPFRNFITHHPSTSYAQAEMIWGSLEPVKFNCELVISREHVERLRGNKPEQIATMDDIREHIVKIVALEKEMLKLWRMLPWPRNKPQEPPSPNPQAKSS